MLGLDHEAGEVLVCQYHKRSKDGHDPNERFPCIGKGQEWHLSGIAVDTGLVQTVARGLGGKNDLLWSQIPRQALPQVL